MFLRACPSPLLSHGYVSARLSHHSTRLSHGYHVSVHVSHPTSPSFDQSPRQPILLNLFPPSFSHISPVALPPSHVSPFPRLPLHTATFLPPQARFFVQPFSLSSV
ncbi:hypothetical protein CLOP_g2567 [Closterium sp. NIES-67]|nr:hypothetical protein CLOP_g2567 [Closterium sp. NIES-67]